VLLSYADVILAHENFALCLVFILDGTKRDSKNIDILYFIIPK